MPHEDGNAYSKVVATISLGSSLCLELTSKPSPSAPGEKEDGEGVEPARNVEQWRILQEPRSLLVTTGNAYTELLHGISPLTHDENLSPETVVNWELLGDDTKTRIEKASEVNERNTRVSLTYRDVLKVSKVGLGILGRR